MPVRTNDRVIEVFYRYRVHPSQSKAFEDAYGSAGPWARLFRQHAGFRRTRLFRHRDDPMTYVTIDVWETKEDWDRFRTESSLAYARLDRELRMLYLEELLLGYYEGTDEYHAPVDARA